MILHIVPDEKFIDMAYSVFEKANPENNTFLLITNKKKLKYIKNTPLTKYNFTDIFNGNISKFLSKYDYVVVHSLTRIAKFLIEYYLKNQKIIWLGWGFDYYNHITNNNLSKILKPETNKFYSKSKSNVKEQIKYFIDSKIFSYKKIFKKIDYFAPVLYEDFILFTKVYDDLNFKYIDWNYGNLEDDFLVDFRDKTIVNDNILIGNSSSFENNHLDAFQTIESFNLDNKKIIVPLSYGDNKYRDYIIAKATERFSEKFIPLVEFMSMEEYLKIISSCSIVIMNHKRQQAVGNIIIMIYLGAKIFLDKSNTVYEFFKKQGAYIYTLEELEDEIETKLDINAIEQNREILKNNWSRYASLEKTKKLVNRMYEK